MLPPMKPAGIAEHLAGLETLDPGHGCAETLDEVGR